jgi:hypothetical protein
LSYGTGEEVGKRSLNLEAIIPQRLKPELFATLTYELKLVPFKKCEFFGKL